MLLVAAILVWARHDVAYGAPDDTITLTAPAPNTVLAESDDYATQVLNDPWDMNNSEDVDKPYNVVNYGVNGGVWTGTATTPASSNVFFQYGDVVNAQQTDGSFSYLGEKSGANYPVDSSRFTRLWVRMSSQMSGQSIMWFFRASRLQRLGQLKLPSGNPGLEDLHGRLAGKQLGRERHLDAKRPLRGLTLRPAVGRLIGQRGTARLGTAHTEHGAEREHSVERARLGQCEPVS